MIRTDDPLEAFLTGALRLWTGLTAAAGLFGLAVSVTIGWNGLVSLCQTGPFSIHEQTLACVAIVWLSWGAGLLLLRKWRRRPERFLGVLGSLLVLLLYVNVLRENLHYGDVGAYVGAAFDLHEGRPFHIRYLSPPLVATMCQPFLGLGHHGLAGAFWLANVVSLVALLWLLKAVLGRYAFGWRLSLAITVLFMIVNVPILRTLGYGQLNLHVTDLILLTILLYPRHRILSALSLAVAASLKTTPIVLAIPFLWVGDRKWILAFVAGVAALTGATALFYGWASFAQFLHNSRNIYAVAGINFRENSVDSLIRSTAALWGRDVQPIFLFLLKIPVLAVIAAAAISNGRHSTYASNETAGSRVLNVFPAMLILMLLASPLVWEHHAVFVALPFLVIVKKLDSPLAWTWYGLAYALEFLMPTFDFYPWSFGRLAAPLILTGLMLMHSRREDAAWFVAIRNRLERMSWGRDLRAAPRAGE